MLQTIIAVMMVTSSCTSFQPLVATKPLSDDFLVTLKTDTWYVFTLNTGIKQRVRLTGIADRQLSGIIIVNQNGKSIEIPYKATFDEISQYVSSISAKQFSQGRTMVLVGVVVAAVIALVIAASNTSFDVWNP
jgi:hypothetical protein